MEATADPYDCAGFERLEVQRVDVEATYDFGIGGEQDLKTPIEQEAVNGVGAHTTPHAIGGLEHLALDTGATEILRTGQTSETGTHDHDWTHHCPRRVTMSESRARP